MSVADPRLARRLVLDELFDLSLYRALRAISGCSSRDDLDARDAPQERDQPGPDEGTSWARSNGSLDVLGAGLRTHRGGSFAEQGCALLHPEPSEAPPSTLT